MTQDSESLKPCPFCGGRAAVEVDNEEWEIARVLCTDCDADGPYEDLVEHASEADAVKKACDRWNARLAAAPSTSVREEVEYEVWQDDAFGDGEAMVAGSTNLADAQHYAAVYSQDGPAWVVEVTRRHFRAEDPAALVPSTDEGKRHG